MRLAKMLTPFALAFLVAACAGSTVSVKADRPKLAAPPASLTSACTGPVALPDAALNQAQVEEAWARDRAALLACNERRAGLARFYESRDAKIAGGTK